MNEKEACVGQKKRDRLKRLVDPSGPYVWLVYLPLFAVPWLFLPPTALELGVSLAGLTLFVIIYLASWRHRGRATIAAAIAVLLLSFALAFFGGNWSVIAIYAVAIATERRPARQARWLVGFIVVAAMIFAWSVGIPWYFNVMVAVFALMVAVGKMSEMALAEKHDALLAAQEEVRRLSREAERERIGRDLHDLLGRTLTLIALKADLAVKQAGRDPAAAEDEMREVAKAARTGLAEVRAAVSGLVDSGLAREIMASQTALAAARIECSVESEGSDIPATIGGVLAMALREAVTNVIRHAGARHCRIAVEGSSDQVTLSVADDGRAGRFREGSGLSGMRSRLAAAGGILQVETGPGGTRILASLPLRPA